MLLFNSSGDETTFTLPAEPAGRSWQVRLDTRDGVVTAKDATEARRIDAGGQLTLLAHSMAVLTGAPAHTDGTGSAQDAR